MHGRGQMVVMPERVCVVQRLGLRAYHLLALGAVGGAGGGWGGEGWGWGGGGGGWGGGVEGGGGRGGGGGVAGGGVLHYKSVCGLKLGPGTGPGCGISGPVFTGGLAGAGSVSVRGVERQQTDRRR